MAKEKNSVAIESPRVELVPIPESMATNHGPRLDQGVPGGQIVARVNGQFLVVDAFGRPIPGKKFDVNLRKIVDA